MLGLGTVSGIGLVVSAVYGRAVDSPFVFDDEASIVTNPSIVRLWPLIGGPDAPGPLNPRALIVAGRPLVNLSFALNYHFGRLEPAGYRLVNLVLHFLCAALLAAIVRRTLRLEYFAGRWEHAAWPLSVAVALVWAVHPLVTDAVVYVTQRTELLMALCYLTTLYGSLRHWSAESAGARAGWLVVATLACLAGMASKQAMASAPLVVLLFDRTFVSGSLGRALRQSRLLYAGLALGWVFLLVLTTAQGPLRGSTQFLHRLPLLVWWITEAKVLFLYLRLACWPWPLSIHYGPSYLETAATGWPWVVAATITGTVTATLLWRRRAVGFVGASVVLILAPTILVPVVGEAIAERRMYLPLAGLTALAIVGAHRLIVDRWSGAGGHVSLAAVLALVVGLSLVTARRLAVYRTALTLWQDAILHHPDDPFAHNNLGTTLLREGRPQDALAHFEAAARLDPDDPAAFNNLGGALTSIGRPEEAIAPLERALALEPGTPKPKVHMNLGNALLNEGHTAEAIAHLEEAVRLQPDQADTHYSLGGALLSVGRSDDAILHLDQAVHLRPDDADAHNNLANALLKTGQSERAAAHYRHALSLRPDFAEAHNNLGAALLNLGRPQEAIDEFEQALRLRPDHENAHYNLGSALLETGQPGEAAGHFEHALKHHPDDPQTRLQRARAYAGSDQLPAALTMAESALALARAQGETRLAQEIDAWLASHRPTPPER